MSKSNRNRSIITKIFKKLIGSINLFGSVTNGKGKQNEKKEELLNTHDI